MRLVASLHRVIAKPTGRSVKKRSSYILIFDALEQAETAYIRFVQRIIIRIVAGHDSAGDLAVLSREE